MSVSSSCGYFHAHRLNFQSQNSEPTSRLTSRHYRRKLHSFIPVPVQIFHNGLHDIAMKKMEEFGIETVLGQRAVNTGKVEKVPNGMNRSHGNNGVQKDGGFIVHLSGGKQLRAALVVRVCCSFLFSLLNLMIDHLPRRSPTI